MDMKRILQALDTTSTKPVEGADNMSKFLSIIDKNDVEIIKEEIDNNKTLNEGANPHKVSLPVQMAMQHYAKPAVEKKPSLLKKYFAEAEEVQQQELLKKQNQLAMYSRKIANRVLETSKIKEARLAPDQLAKLMQYKQQNAKPVQPQSASIEPLSPEKQAEVDSWAQDLKKHFDTRTTTGRHVKREPIKHVEPKPAEPAPVENPGIDMDKLSLPEAQALLAKMNHLIRTMEKVEQLSIRAEKFPGGLTPGLQADLELELPTPRNAKEYDDAIEVWDRKLEKLQQFISMKRATWAKKKTPVYENEGQRDEKTIQQEINALSKERSKVEYALQKVKEITKEIKYDDTAGSIISRVRALANSGINIDEADLKYAEQDVFEAERALESAVYGLEQAFEDAVRSVQNQIDELESEVDEIHWNRKYGRE